MGIESDQVVYEYLSRVGDVAQQRQLPSAARMRLVAELRNEIDRRRSKAVVDSPAAVRRILDRMGSPDEIVEAAGGGGAGVPQEPAAAVPPQRAGATGATGTTGGDGTDGARGADDGDAARGGRQRKGLRRVVPRPRSAVPPAAAPSPPHLASARELGKSAERPDWWRVEDGGPFDVGDGVPGFVGGVEIPELLKSPPPKEDDGTGGKAAATAPAAEKAAEKAAPAAPAVRRRRLPRLWPEGGVGSPLPLLAAALLVAGAVLGHLVPLALGWLIVHLSRRLSPAETKWAVLGLPGSVAAAWAVWLWGRVDGRWGEPVAEGRLGDAVAGSWPWVLRGAAVASALYLVWRARRPRG
ncbi:membrane protein [Streptomyces cyaneogriseus subsp. noncyanogenus]|uniref:Membrane protein n=1 Tax=Streptomyces cyaneogriseus subsp. noncyanogenus TaxID=477245 RepID=A0A0C5FSY6_9ACTN|nr:hypothetical protein [Streptomyces cyaneogriseus]AJP03157.1 membrane protein [Streptomyces cyaneogriseus subsp. noncyanogenus]